MDLHSHTAFGFREIRGTGYQDSRDVLERWHLWSGSSIGGEGILISK